MSESEQSNNPKSGEPKIWIVSTGTEILQGHYADTNAQWLSQQIFGLGLRIDRHMALADDHNSLHEELEFACRRCDLIIMTGGLGPTADDLNRQSVARVYGVELEEDSESLERIERLFSSRGRLMPPSNNVQALFPVGAQILPNNWGTAPGFLMPPPEGSELRASLLALPGPPRENRPMFETMVADLIRERFGVESKVLRTLTIHTAGVAESHLNDRIQDFFDRDPKVGVALLAGKWRVDVRLTLQGESDAENDRLQEHWIDHIVDRVGEENIFGLNDTTLPGALGRMLKERGETLALAESCTGGLIAKQITDEPGCSDYFLEGFVTYSNEAKMRTLGVSKETLDEHGAVSSQVAEEMAAGAQKATGADWVLSVTGVAGPDGGTADKPVGLVYMGLAEPDRHVIHRRMLGLGGEREAIREFTAVQGLDLVRRAIIRVSD